MPIRKRKSRKKKSSGVGGALLAILVAFLLAAGAGAWLVLAPFGSATETFVELAPGSSTRQIGQQLEAAGVIRSQFAFDLTRWWKRGTLRAGEYRFDHAAPVTEVYARIARGDVFTKTVVVPEGANIFDIAAKLEQAGLGTRQEFIDTAERKVGLVADLDPGAKSLEGYLFPDTYRFPRKATSQQIIATMVRRFRAVSSEIGLETMANLSPASRSTHDVVTLASLVERETAVASERPLVASVLTNRLAKKIPLMTDPAVIYGLQAEGQWRGAIYQSDLADPKHDTLYNTYRHAGLPPGPIANPGAASLRAAMHPAATDYLYFVAAGADPQGKSRFAATLDEHNKNVASYRKSIKQAGGR